MTVQSNWYENFFHGVAFDLWRKAVSQEQTQEEADFLVKALNCDPNCRLLDIPCGNGRHSLELSNRGYRMTGVDISEEFIQEARGVPGAAGKEVDWVLTDMRDIKWESQFDGAFCWGNSFGYLKFGDMEVFLAALSNALKPRGRFVFDTGMAAEAILPNMKEQEWSRIDNIIMAEENRYHAGESCLETNYTFIQNGKVETRRSFHWVYTVAEIKRMLEQAGFITLETYSSLDRQPFGLGSQYLIIVAEKRK
jgi:SAM-dependent methyltransferase